ncbi:UBP-type zinc finger domain-containing protein [Sphaerisporangium sp. TRM90804]|uniref:UBP-type zinc finger domain-containing protein n=1 Tax=Sphaerisporangium sp. TRM90804 TaxID=3031113 RepID=UPI002448E54E|nr:UBP-type zinc finger domain-containing protein [Sphaerisporangium sp. TRM90804]MDH2423892.1 UBP-type zinc finger domain-containing protein [Sphaerisporangium sp. TRM90804]
MTCNHLELVKDVQPSNPIGCDECLAMGSRWVHLRTCLTCGHVGCCDSSPNRHASGHYATEAHPLAESFEPGEDWAWCYPDQLLLEPSPSGQGSRSHA